MKRYWTTRVRIYVLFRYIDTLIVDKGARTARVTGQPRFTQPTATNETYAGGSVVSVFSSFRFDENARYFSSLSCTGVWQSERETPIDFFVSAFSAIQIE
jgi:hypothetical protein